MASYRPRVGKKIKKLLLNETGGKCANPGCLIQTRLELHHIKVWSVYKKHNAKHMIPLCASCHEIVHNGNPKISDYELYRWKKIKRRDSTQYPYVDFPIEPGLSHSIVFGPVTIKSANGFIAVEIGEQKIQYQIIRNKFFFINLEITKTDGSDFILMNHNVLSGELPKGVNLTKSANKLLVDLDININTDFLPEWALVQIRNVTPQLVQNNKVKLLDMQVDMPGQVKVSNVVMVNKEKVFVLTKEFFYLVVKDRAAILTSMQLLDLGFIQKEMDYSNQSYLSDVGISFLKG